MPERKKEESRVLGAVVKMMVASLCMLVYTAACLAIGAGVTTFNYAVNSPSEPDRVSKLEACYAHCDGMPCADECRLLWAPQPEATDDSESLGLLEDSVMAMSMHLEVLQEEMAKEPEVQFVEIPIPGMISDESGKLSKLGDQLDGALSQLQELDEEAAIREGEIEALKSKVGLGRKIISVPIPIPLPAKVPAKTIKVLPPPLPETISQ